MSGSPPFGDSNPNRIVARELSGDIDLTLYEPEIAEWLARGLTADVDQRFVDASEMQAAWREAVQAVLDRDNRAPWWRRWFGVHAVIRRAGALLEERKVEYGRLMTLEMGKPMKAAMPRRRNAQAACRFTPTTRRASSPTSRSRRTASGVMSRSSRSAWSSR